MRKSVSLMTREIIYRDTKPGFVPIVPTSQVEDL